MSTASVDRFAFGPSGGACDVAQDSVTGSTVGSASLAQFGNERYMAQKFTAGNSYTLCGADFQLSAVGSPTGTLTATVYSHDSGNDSPNVQIGAASGTVDASTIGGSEETVSFSGMSSSLTASTIYWAVVFKSTTNNGNHLLWHFEEGGAGGNSIMKDGDGAGIWASDNATKSGKFQFFSSS